ncbi:MAG TPA: anti-sigma factor [Acidimicrobiales bacterium]|nr:anti-sigma factor [Acidimicrobiales bacterium]
MEHPLDDLAAYVLDALDDDESAAIEDHLAGCGSCAAEVDAHRAALARLTVDEPPPPAVWQRIARGIGATGVPTPLPSMPSGGGAPPPPPAGRPAGDPAGARAPVPLAAPHPPHMRRAGHPLRRWGAAAAGVAAAAALVAAGVALTGDEQPADLADLAEAAAHADDARIATLAGSTGVPAARVVADGPTGYVLVDDLPRLPAGREYQLWKLAGDDVAVSLGVIGDGTTPAAAFGLPADTTPFAISTEPAGGSPVPTGQIVATGTFA